MNKGIISLLTIFIGTSLFGQGKKPLYTDNELIIETGKQVQASSLYISNPNHSGQTTTLSVWETLQGNGAASMQSLVDAATFPAFKDVYRIVLKPGVNADSVLNVIKKHPNVMYASRVAIARMQAVQQVPIELDESKQWYFGRINMTNTWWENISYDENNTIKIAVIDNAIRITHEDLAGKIAKNRLEIPGNGIDDDGNNYIDDYLGWDVADSDNNPMPYIPDQLKSTLYFSHGTHVAGIIAAADNSTGIASLGINNEIIPIKAVKDGVLNDLEISVTNIIKGFEYAIRREADIINCSFATEVHDDFFGRFVKEAVDKGIIVVAAVGNSEDSKAYYPAAFDGVIAVGATDRNDKKWKSNFTGVGSNYGNYVDVMAPGQDIYSTVARGDHEYAQMTGTSMAAPIVASFAGLLLTKFGDDIRRNMETVIKQGCDNIDGLNPGYAGMLGYGRINIDRTFNYALAGPFSVGNLNAADFTIYPNPASSLVNIPFESLSTDGQPLQLTVYGSNGASVQQQTLYTGEVAVSGLPQGIYYMVVSTTEGKSFRSRLLINR